MNETWKITIVGAASLRGKELNEALADSAFASARIALVDEEAEAGRLEASGDEATVIQRIDRDSFEDVDFAFFTGAPEITRKHWQEALSAGGNVIDLSNALEGETGVFVCAPWLAAHSGSSELKGISLSTRAVIPAHAVSLALALIMSRAEQAGQVRSASATVLEPASEYGSAAIDELHQQTVSLLNFQSLPKDVYDEQIAFNVVPSFGDSQTIGQSEARIRRHYALIRTGRMADLAIQVVHVPVFHGVGLSIALDFDQPLTRDRLESALAAEHIELIGEDVDPPNNLSSAGQTNVQVRVRPQDGGDQLTNRFWLWASFDNLKLSSLNAVACAMELRRLRPKGKVQ
ncbi:MAG: segregation protein B [Silvibacterium sp.]|nr:segregation protein B [Silvibacterium sp.]